MGNELITTFQNYIPDMKRKIDSSFLEFLSFLGEYYEVDAD